MKGKLYETVKFYIYKIEFETGETYIGSHIERKENDGYICSSLYWKRHPELKLKNREILFYLPTLEQMNIMETICIISDKCNSLKNVNGNYGNWLYNFHSKLDSPWNKNLKMSEDFKNKISDSESEPILCIETMEILKNSQGNGHYSNATKGIRKTINGKHYRKLTYQETEEIRKGNIEEAIKLNKAFLIEIYADTIFYYNIENNIAWDNIELPAKMLSESPSDFTKRLGINYKGLTFIEVDSCFIFNNNIKVIKVLPLEKKISKVKCVETGIIYNSVKEAEEKNNTKHISSALNGSRKTAGRLHWIRI